VPEVSISISLNSVRRPWISTFNVIQIRIENQFENSTWSICRSAATGSRTACTRPRLRSKSKWSSRPRPMPPVFEAKASGPWGQGQCHRSLRPTPVVLEVKANATGLRGQRRWSLRSRPRPVVLKVKAKVGGLRGQGQGQWSSSSRPMPRLMTVKIDGQGKSSFTSKPRHRST